MGDGGGGTGLSAWSGAQPDCLCLLTFIKSRSSLLAPADPSDPGKKAVKQLWCGGGGFCSFVPVLFAFVAVLNF